MNTAKCPSRGDRVRLLSRGWRGTVVSSQPAALVGLGDEDHIFIVWDDDAQPDGPYTRTELETEAAR